MVREQHITFRIESRLTDVPLLGRLVNTLCGIAKLSVRESNDVEVCIVEALNNAVRHAYNEEPGHFVELSVSLVPGKLVFDVFDSGHSADPEAMHSDHRHTLEDRAGTVGQLAEGGRGLAIMQELMDSLEYTPGNTRNRLRLTKRLADNGG